jgi:hypothetical protein
MQSRVSRRNARTASGLQWLVGIAMVVLLSLLIAGGTGALILWLLGLFGFSITPPWNLAILGVAVLAYASIWFVPAIWDNWQSAHAGGGIDAMPDTPHQVLEEESRAGRMRTDMQVGTGEQAIENPDREETSGHNGSPV